MFDPMSESLVIDCDTCVRQHTDTCGDCLVSFICDRDPGEAVVIELAEWRSLDSLARAGLVPRLRHRPEPPRSGSPAAM